MAESDFCSPTSTTSTTKFILSGIMVHTYKTSSEASRNIKYQNLGSSTWCMVRCCVYFNKK